MGRKLLPLVIPDASAFAKSLSKALTERHSAGEGPPGHVELLNLLARSLGARNLQALKAVRMSPLAAQTDEGVALKRPYELRASQLAAEDKPPPLALTPLAQKALDQFDSRGRLQRWPNKFSVQSLAMWVLWAQFDGRRVYSEREVNQVLIGAHSFGDHATLRRELINHKLMSRRSDCTDYRKLPLRPNEEVQALLQAWRSRRRGQAALGISRKAAPRSTGGDTGFGEMHAG